MSSALSLIVFGQVYFLGPVNNVPSITPNVTLHGQSGPLHGVRRSDYTYTPGVGGHKVHIEPVNWNTARKTCEEEGAYLAIINSVAESKVIEDLFRKSKPGVQNYLHIGFHDLYKEGEYVTIHGETLTTAGFDEWHTGEPDNNGNNEHCGSVFEDGKLNDIPCNESHGFVCELPYVAENSIVPQ